MIDSRWRKLQRDLWLHRGRSLLVILAVAIAMIGAGSVLNAWSLVQGATRDGYLASLPASATIQLDQIQPDWLPQLRALPQMGAVLAQRQWSTRVRADNQWQRALISAREDYLDQSLAKLSPEAGQWPPPAGALVVELSSLAFAGAEVGRAALVADAAGEARSVELAGVVRDVSVAPGWMENVVYAFADSATLSDLGAPAGFDQLLIRHEDPNASHAQLQQLAEMSALKLEQLGAQVVNLSVPEPGEHIHAAQMDSLLITQGAFGLLCLGVCAFLVVNLINGVLAGQAREIGIMKTLGASAAQISQLYLAMAALLGLLAGLIALPLAMIAGYYYARFKTEMLNFPAPQFLAPWWVIALQILVAVGLPLLAAAIPVRRATAVPVVASLREVGIAAPQGEQLPHWLGSISSWVSRSLLLAIGNAFRRRQRMVLTLLVLASGGAVYLGAASLGQAVRGSVDQQFQTQAFDLSARLAEPQSPQQLEQLVAAIPGVEAAEAWRGARASIIHDGHPERGKLRMIGLPTDSQLLRPRMLQGQWLDAANAEQLVISRALARHHPDWAPGQRLTLRIDGKDSQWVIGGVIDTGPQAAAYVARDALGQALGDQLASSIMVRIDGDRRSKPLPVVASLREELAAQGIEIASTQLMSEARKVIEDHLLMVVDFLGSMGWLMMIVGGMGLASTMSLSVLERTREIGVMRAIGASHRTIMGLVLAECAVIALLGWLLALPLSIPMSLILGYAFSQIMFNLPQVVFPGLVALLGWACWMLLVSLIAGAWPARNANRVPVASALGYE